MLSEQIPVVGGQVAAELATASAIEPLLRNQLLPGHDLRRHQPDMVHVGRRADIDHFRNISEIQIVIAPDKHHALGAVGIDLSQPRQQDRPCSLPSR